MFDSDIKILNLLFKIMPFVFWKGRDGRYLGGNDNQARAFGFASPDDFVGKTIFEIIEDQCLAKIIDDNDNKIMNNGESVTFEEIFMTPAGKKIYLTQKNPIVNDKKKVIGLIGFAMDITDIKAKQQEIEEANRKLAVEKYELEIASYQAEKQSQEKFIQFIDKIQNDIRAYKLETLNDKVGNSVTINEEDKKITLTHRERQVLYYMSLNKAPKDIALILTVLENKKIAPATVQAVINKQLYIKFGVYNIGQLIEKATALKLLPSFLEH
jgi:PAS domain S-box-containing protein